MTHPRSEQGAQFFARFRDAATHFCRARQVDLDFVVQFADVPALVTVRGGKVTQISEAKAPLLAYEFAIKGSSLGWAQFWLPVPAAGWHDIFALNKRKEFSIEGNLQPLMAHLQFVKDLLASPREEQS